MASDGGVPDGRRPRQRQRPAAGGADLISELPDDVLLLILARLRCARAAAATGTLSRRWRGLWEKLPELSFRDVSPNVLDAALERVSGPALALLDIHVPEHYGVTSVRVSSWLNRAATLCPRRFAISTSADAGTTSACPVELPCYGRATSISLHLRRIDLRLLPSGEFEALEKLAICGASLDCAALLPRCPRLRVLSVSGSLPALTVRSVSLEELHVEVDDVLPRLDVVAPRLKELGLSSHGTAFTGDSSDVLVAAPMLERLSWSCLFHLAKIEISDVVCLQEPCIDDVVSHGDGDGDEMSGTTTMVTFNGSQEVPSCPPPPDLHIYSEKFDEHIPESADRRNSPTS